MNQAILFNDDLTYSDTKQCWQCSGILSGEKVTVFIYSEIIPSQLTQTIKFDWEIMIEDWLEDNEPDDKNHIILTC